MMNKCEQQALFETRNPGSGSSPVTIELCGLGPIPSFKNRKVIRTWVDRASAIAEFLTGHWWIRKDSIKIKAMLYLEHKYQEWMETATRRIESQLRSALATGAAGTRMDALAPSRIATLLPCDDCWAYFREVVIRSELCEPGKEGATIRIERIS